MYRLSQTFRYIVIGYCCKGTHYNAFEILNVMRPVGDCSKLTML